jgi:hypothetical protein
MTKSERRTAYLGTGALMALTLLAYLPALANGFVWDDLDHIAGNPRIATLSAAASYFGAPEGRYYRPLIFLSYAMEHRLWGAWPFGAHLVNVVLHLCNAALLVVAGSRSGVPLPAVLVGAAVFALHPVQSEAVAYVSGRTDLLITGAALLSLIALAGRGRPLLRGIALAAAGSAAMLSKETGFALAMVWIWVAARRIPTWLERLLVVGPGLMAAVLLLALRPGGAGVALSLPTAAQLGGAGHALMGYVALLIWPAGLQVDRLTPLPASAAAIAVGVLALALALAAVVWGLSRRDGVGEWTAWSAAFYLPAANVVAIYPGIAAQALFTPEHNLYAPLAGLGVLAAVAGRRLLATVSPPARRAVLVGAGALLLVWTALTAQRVAAWRDAQSLFASAAAAGSRSPRVWMNHGNGLLRRGALTEAVQAFEVGTALAPGDAGLWMNLAVSRQKLGELAAAEAAYRRAVALSPNDAQVWENLGTLLLARGEMSAARQAFTRALELDPARPMARRALAATAPAVPP